MKPRVDESTHHPQRLTHKPVGQRQHSWVVMVRSQGQALTCNLARLNMLPAHRVREVNTPEHRHPLGWIGAIAQQVTSVRENTQGLRRGISLGCRQRWPEGQVKVELLAGALKRWCLGLCQLYPLPEMLDGLGVRGAVEREMTCLEPVIDRGLKKSAFCEMVGHDFRLARHDVGKPV